MNKRFLCIHGHFYQPPRENPWINFVECQEGAYPYHDWNERITRECYGPNTCARIHGQGNRIVKLLNNYEYMSFNFGPTLLCWLKETHPWVYQRILSADRASQKRYAGHGNALAQVYNHMIMPLATMRDKLTQIRWGLADFRHRFGRDAEGMWLAETAVDTDTLKLMSDEGVKFTILSPGQARGIRPINDRRDAGRWEDVSGGRIDTTRPYRVFLDRRAGRFIDIFFYNGELSKAVAYERILESGQEFLSRIEHSFKEHDEWPQIISIATDGESYGHHFKFGDLALAWLFQHLHETSGIALTNYAFFLERFPPKEEVEIIENSSWSCVHGIERWRSDCGCSVSHRPGWNQAWRFWLRNGLNMLQRDLSAIFEKTGRTMFKDPWDARDDYIHLLLDDSACRREDFLERHKKRDMAEDEAIQAFQLLESQRMSMYMFTSCGWFFDDISGIESSQVLKYAARAIDLVKSLAEKDLEAHLLNFLARAKSNLADYGDGAAIYETMVRPSRVDSSRTAAHYAASAVMEGVSCDAAPFSRSVSVVNESQFNDNGMGILLGEVRVMERWTGAHADHRFLCIHRDGVEVKCLVGEGPFDTEFDRISKETLKLCEDRAGEEVILKEFFNYHPWAREYRMNDMIPDVQNHIIRAICQRLDDNVRTYVRTFDSKVQQLLGLMKMEKAFLPDQISYLIQLLLVDRLLRVMSAQSGDQDLKDITRLLAWCGSDLLQSKKRYLREEAKTYLRRQMGSLAAISQHSCAKDIIDFLNLVKDMGLDIDLWECQNMFYDLYTDIEFIASLGPERSGPFLELGRRLGFQMDGGEDA